jgi:hypothetical protein
MLSTQMLADSNQSSSSPTRWYPPHQNWYKINVDAAGLNNIFLGDLVPLLEIFGDSLNVVRAMNNYVVDYSSLACL